MENGERIPDSRMENSGIQTRMNERLLHISGGYADKVSRTRNDARSSTEVESKNNDGILSTLHLGLDPRYLPLEIGLIDHDTLADNSQLMPNGPSSPLPTMALADTLDPQFHIV